MNAKAERGGESAGSDLDRLTYEELVDTLEDLTRRMSSGEVGIEEAAELYERAGEVHRAALSRLERVRERIRTLGGAEDEP